ncbi:MAG TPA: ArsA-related P-loop ATPase [Solirubrobacteraceae bacterium]|nr:ArsA-related P-loop ATPase [Solirubrobacteraceae bacterium]
MSGIGERLDGKRICIVAGSGGVGKTTASAALALGLAASGKRVAVVTIDPAKRLADSLGLEELGNEPRLVDASLLSGHGIEMRGELWAMMLDPKATFDGLIAKLAPDARTRDDVLGNRIYAQLSSAIAGSQEFSAVAKLYELDRDGGYDAIVLDTPPSRNALDFLDAPDRLTDFFEGRALKLFLVPTSIAGRLLGAGSSVVFGILKKLTGVNLLEDMSVLLRSMGALIDGFRERAAAVKALLSDPATTFLIVTSPEREPVAEAIFFRQKLREARMPFGGLIVNRAAVLSEAEMTDPGAIRAELRDALGDSLAAKVAAGAEDLQVLAARHSAAMERLRSELDEPDPIVVPRLDVEVQDIDGLLVLYRHLAANGRFA